MSETEERVHERFANDIVFANWKCYAIIIRYWKWLKHHMYAVYVLVVMCWLVCQMTDRMNKQIIYINIINGDDRRLDIRNSPNAENHPSSPTDGNQAFCFCLFFLVFCVIFFCYSSIELVFRLGFYFKASFILLANTHSTAVLWSTKTCAIWKQWHFN